MADRARTAKIWIALVVSMSVGAVVLMLLDTQGPSAGAFSLASYTRLDSVQKVTACFVPTDSYAWSRIEVYYSDTEAGNLQSLSKQFDLPNAEDMNCHFVVCNGVDGKDGLIEATHKWKYQRSALHDRNWYGTADTIRICVVGNGLRALPTDAQLKRTAALVEALSRKFNIAPRDIEYPGTWQF